MEPYLTRKRAYCFVKFTRKQDYLGRKDTKNIVSHRIVIGKSYLLVVEMCEKTMDFHD